MGSLTSLPPQVIGMVGPHSAGQAQRSPEPCSRVTELQQHPPPGPSSQPPPQGLSGGDVRISSQTYLPNATATSSSQQLVPTPINSPMASCSASVGQLPVHHHCGQMRPSPPHPHWSAYCLRQALPTGHVLQVHPRVGKKVLEGDSTAWVPL